MEKNPCVYILANKKNGTLYTGVTSNLVQRVYQHKNNLADGFTKKYGIHTLVYYECSGDMYSAISHEKQIKSGSRKKKIELIESMNPEWKDLYDEIV
jgi:putative endonuclease